ncbi:hypothetical protein E3A20_26140 [Planctomyces bekefii]|uniref:Uncharacterized protein n=1 Tax=Planctomyces bekefii TaxID=1653850 RepID=A0A5C6M1W4_9PLAN|nr:hypothetical protein E3A20_26140 [Planctomyces bekefii]
MAVVTMQDIPTHFGPTNIPTNWDEATTVTNITYKEQVVVQNPITTDAAYSHGFTLYNAGPNCNIYQALVTFSIRQLNDQQDIAYRDTRK